MTLQEFQFVKTQFDNGNIQIQNADLDAFLFDNKWYPIRSFVNQVHPETNNHLAIKTITLLIPYIRIKENVGFQGCNNLPIPINQHEKLEELRVAMARVSDLLH
jgi:hypothetical protein